jgi:transcriptional regulator with GAF, ATPase, and Fis domain
VTDSESKAVMEQHLMRAMALVQEFVQGSGDLERTLSELTAVATEALGADMAGLTIRDDRGRASTVVYTDRRAPAIDQAQYDHDRGPWLDAARTRTVCEVEDTRREDRWPEFAEAAARHGVHSSLSMPVVAADDGLGALNFYDHRVAYFDDAKRELAGPFAGHCAVAALYWSSANEATGLAKAMDSRAVIEQAKGVIMATTGRTADEAFQVLRSQSQQENRKLRDIAQEIVDRQAR